MVHIEFKTEQGKISITPCPYPQIHKNGKVCYVGSFACRHCKCFIDGDDTSVECRADDLIDDEE